MQKHIRNFVGGFTLAGRRVGPKKIITASRTEETADDMTTITHWPKKVSLFGTTYTLENVIAGEENNMKGGFENAEYV